jgi:hypothetical protein
MNHSIRLVSAPLAGIVLAALAMLPLAGMAQTGQALIANPLLSPAKIKEVKRQIAEAAHRDPAPPQAAMPPSPPMAQVPDHLMAQMRQGPPNMGQLPIGDAAKAAMARLQVMAIVGKSAFLGKTSQVGTEPAGMQSGPGMPTQMGGMPQMGGMMPSMASQQSNQVPRRASSVLIRDREVVFIEGFDVIPTINGDSVRLALASAPHETIFQASVQPTLHSPNSAPANAALEKPSAEYANTVSPDATSMTPGANAAGGPGQNPLQGQALQRPRPVVVGEGY